MAQNLLTHKVIVVPQQTVRRLTERECKMEFKKAKRADFDKRNRFKLGGVIFIPERNIPEIETEDTHDHKFDSRDDDNDPPRDWINPDPVDRSSVAAFEHSLRDTVVNAAVLLPQGDGVMKCKIKMRHVDPDGQVTGEFNNNPLLNSIIYDVEFTDGSLKEYSANVLVENIYSSVDE